MIETQSLTTDPILAKFRAAVVAAYGERIERIVVFGSRARSEGRLDSDYDVAIFLRDLVDRSSEVNRLAEIQTDMIDESDVFIHAMPFAADAWTERTPLMHDIRSEGLML